MSVSLVRLGLLACLVLTAATPVHAVSVNEGFGYPEGSSLAGQNGGSGWAGPWSNAQTVVDVKIGPGLSFAGLATSGGSATSDPGGVAFFRRQLGSTLGADNTTVFLSFLLRPDAGSGFYGGLNLEGLFVGKSGITTSYGIEGPTDDVSSSSTTPVTGTTAFLVLRADFLPGNDKYSLYVNPTPGAPEPSTADAVKTNFDAGLIDFVFLNNAGNWTTDEIHIGDTFAAVTVPTAVPEPSTLLLLWALPVAAVAARKRWSFPKKA